MNFKLNMTICIACILMAGCVKEFPWESSTKNAVKIHFSSHNLYPEGLAYDRIHQSFVVSSASEGSIGVVNFDGSYKAIIKNKFMTSTTGIKVDYLHNRLWICDVPTGVAAYNLLSGKLEFFTNLTELIRGSSLFINDVALDGNGNVYVTNSAYPAIYKIDKNGKASVFFQEAGFATNENEFGFNGVQFNKEGYLVVAHTALNQLIKIPVNHPEKFNRVQINAKLMMPDGLLLSKNGQQLVVVSGDRVLSFVSQNQWKSATVSTVFKTGTEFPTSLTSDGCRVFVLYSPLDKLLGGEDHDDYTIHEVKLKIPDIF